MGYCDERIKELWAYKTTFGSIRFNVASVIWNILQILTTCILLGTFHRKISIEYLWWPVFESFRVLILTFARFDVLLKDSREFRDNESSFIQTRRIIMFCNFIGIGSLSVGWLLYILLLPRDNKLYYSLYIIFFSTFVVIRILLTTPMFYVLLCNSPFYSNDYLPLAEFNNINQTTEIPIPNTKNTNNNNNNNDNNTTTTTTSSNSNNNNNNNPNYRHGVPINSSVNQEVMWNAIEERQLQLAMEASQRDLMRNVRREQDLEFEIEEQRQKELNNNSSNLKDNIIKVNDKIVDNNDNKSITSNSKNEEIYSKKISVSDLDPLPDEEPKSNESVIVRIRLPNGSRPQRRFHYTDTILGIKNWINHELLNNDLHEYVFNFRLISTMPRTIYGATSQQNSDTLEKVGFWSQRLNREGQSPALYVELEDENE